MVGNIGMENLITMVNKIQNAFAEAGKYVKRLFYISKSCIFIKYLLEIKLF